ncbi:MAG: RNA-binding S4 domain-containing protein [Betaproteobacteria bacterium]|nr:RNA-binding S4 domain-containing protein [Betaproteobacteria bacterium]
MAIVFSVRGDHIRLDQLLKATGLCSSGGGAHAEIGAGKVRVDGVVELRKRAKLRVGQRVVYAGESVGLVAEAPGSGL